MNKYLQGLKWQMPNGHEVDDLANAERTREHIGFLKLFPCHLLDKGEPIDWDQVDDPNEPRCLFQTIVHDRRLRDAGIVVNDGPPICVATIDDEVCVRLEYRQILDGATEEVRADLRSAELQGAKLSDSLLGDTERAQSFEFLRTLGWG